MISFNFRVRETRDFGWIEIFRRFLCFTALAALVCVGQANARAVSHQTVASCTPIQINLACGKLYHLMRYVGGYDYEHILADSEVIAAVKRVGAGEYLDIIKANLQIENPIGFVDGLIVLAGINPVGKEFESSSLWINVDNGTVYVTLRHERKCMLFAAIDRLDHLPESVRAYIENHLGSAVHDPDVPDDVEWIHSTRQ